MRSAPCQGSARTYLLALIDQHRREGVSRLPTIRTMAAGAGVAYATMAKVVRRACDEGLVSARPRGGVMLASGRPQPPAPLQSEDTPHPVRVFWRRIAETLEADLLNGELTPNARLPDFKELERRYQASYRTVRKALEHCRRRGLVSTGEGHYVSSAHRRERSSAYVALIGRNLDYHPALGGNVLRLMHKQAQAFRIGVQRFVLAQDKPPRLVTITPELIKVLRGGKRHPDFAGVVLLGSAMPQALQHELIAHVARAGKPLALLYDESPVDLRPLEQQAPAASFAVGTGTGAGERVMRYLVGLGHTRVAYLSPSHDQIASRKRLEGLQRIASRVPGVQVVPCVAAEERPIPLLTKEWRKLWPLFGQFVNTTDVRRFVLPRLQGLLEKRTEGALLDFLQKQVLFENLLPLMHAAVADRQVTCWVAFNDDCALTCLEFLRQTGLSVPRDISLVGFDNSSAAHAEGLTSYDFDGDRLLREALAFFLHPREVRTRQRGVYEREVEGFVCERSSCVERGRGGSGSAGRGRTSAGRGRTSPKL